MKTVILKLQNSTEKEPRYIRRFIPETQTYRGISSAVHECINIIGDDYEKSPTDSVWSISIIHVK